MKPKSLWKTKPNHSRKSFHLLLQPSESRVTATHAVSYETELCAIGSIQESEMVDNK